MSTSSAASTSRRSVARWTVAAIATGALVVSGSGLVAFAQNGTGESQGPAFVPADAAGYVEARLDMPGGQAEALAEMMTAFPGFADPGSFDMKVDELLGGLTSELGVALPEGDLFGDVLTGEIGLALADLDTLMMGGDPSMLIGLALADAEAASGVMDALMADSPATVTESSYNDVTIQTDTSSSPPMSVAMHADWMILGTGEAMVQSSIDVLDGAAPGLADREDFAAAWSRLPDARLAAAYVDFAPFAGMLDMATMLAAGETGMALPTADIAGILPVDLTAALVAETDRLTLETIVTPGAMAPPQPMSDSELALIFPADTQIYFETREFGAAFEMALDGVAELLAAQEMAEGTVDPSDPLAMFADPEALFGEDSPIAAQLGAPLPQLLDFVSDAAVGVGLSSDGVWLGIAGEVNDAAAADDRVGKILGLLSFLTAMDETGTVVVESEMVGDVEVTSITLPLDDALSQGGVPMGVGDTISVALTDDTLLIGLGDFVQSALLAEGTDSLGTSAGYVDALGDQIPNSGVAYVNVGSLLTVLDPIVGAMTPEWAAIQPFAAGLDRIMAVGIGDDDLDGVRIQVIVGQ